MAEFLFANNAATTLAGDITDSDLTLTVATGTGSLFPSPSAGQQFHVTLVRASDSATEIVRVTARTTDSFTIVRAQESTSAKAFVTGDKVELRVTNAGLANFPQLDKAGSWTAQQTFKELKDTVHTITDGAAFEIDPANGSVQVVTLGDNRSPLATNFEAGQTVLLGVDDGTAYSVTWPSVTWLKNGGTAAAPTLATSGFTWVILFKQNTTLFGAIVGSP